MGYLSTILLLPLIGLIVIAFLPSRQEKAVRYVALAATVAAFIVSMVMFAQFDRAASGIQFEEKIAWIPAINSYYHVGVDGINLPMVILMTFLGFLTVLISWKVTLRIKE